MLLSVDQDLVNHNVGSIPFFFAKLRIVLDESLNGSVL